MKRIDSFILISIVILFSILATTIIHSYYNTLEVNKIDVDLKVGDLVGINLDTDKLWFGTLKPGTTAMRSISVANDYEMPIIVSFAIKGSLQENIAFSDEELWLEPGSSSDVMIYANAPENMPYGNYTSTLMVISSRGH